MCLSVWLHVARLHPQQGPVLGGRRGGNGGASVGRRGGADELWSPALVAAGGFGHRAGAGQDGRSGPRLGCAWARRRLRGPRAPAGPEALGSERLGEVGEGLGEGRRPPSRVVPGGSQGGRAPRPRRPSLHPPRYTPRQAHPAGCSRSRKPCGPPGRAGRVLAGGGGGKGAGAGARRGAACAGHRAAGSPVAGGAAQVQRALRGELESCGRRRARAAGQSERQAQRRALRAPGGSRLRLRPYHPERARSRLISEAKQGRARLVLGWETAWEYRVL